MAHATSSDAEHKHTAKQYIQIAVILAAITLFEVIYPYATNSIVALHGFYYPLLGILSLVKFFLVVNFYMHLRDDVLLIKQIFFSGLIVAVCLYVALYFLFRIFI